MATAVFRNYDQKALDWEYNNRGRVREVEALKADQRAGSDRAKQMFATRLDVPFGPGATEKVDIYLPDGDGPHPVHVFFHGGYWKSNTKDDFGFVALPFVPYGAAVVVVEYGLIPSVTMAELIRQCRAALAWSWHNAPDFGGDRDNITISGHSAGGHITVMMLATDWPAFDPALPAAPVRAACAISGVYDLEPVRLSFQNDELGFTPELVREFSAVLLEPRVHVPLLLPVGGDEGPEFIRQSEDMAAAWDAKGMDARAWVMPGHNHFTTINHYLDPDSELSRAVRTGMGIG